MKILMVSSYPPDHCGIGAYAAQHVTALRNEGHVVNVLAHPATCPGGDFAADLLGGWRFLRVARFAPNHDKVIIQYTQSFFYAQSDAADRLRTSLAVFLVALFLWRKLEIIVHETEFRPTSDAVCRGFRGTLDRFIWKLCRRIALHSEREKDSFCKYYRLSPATKQLQVVPHDRYFQRHAQGGREEIRTILGLPKNKTIFLCIGFVQPHKGFDRLLRVLQEITSEKILVRIVGSVRIGWQPALDYAAKLHALAAADPRCAFIETFVTDEDFDRWIIASSYVVVPYHEIWSSGVTARAKLHARPVIASNVGAIPEQLPPGSMTFSGDDELRGIVQRIATGSDGANDTKR